MPVIAARLFFVAVHALLHDGPFAVVGDEEPMKIEVEAVLHGRAVDLGDETAGARQASAVETAALAGQAQLVGGLARMLAAAAADVDTEFVRQRSQPALERANDAGGDPGGMPVHPHH